MHQDRLEDRLQAEARQQGFTLFGIAPATEADGFEHLCTWLEAGYAGSMAYMHKYREQRSHPASILASVQSVVMLGFNYAMPGEASTTPTTQPGDGRVARYAQGPDYHDILWQKLRNLTDWLQQDVPDCEARGVCDTAPLLERDFARRAGLGWIGKNTMLIHKQYGSYFFLAALLCSVPLQPTGVYETRHCGTCTACLQACPTQAFPSPGVLDATRCISYYTIEHRGDSPLSLREKFGSWIFGCDVCQEVCPWNAKPSRVPLPLSDFPRDEQLIHLDAVEVLQMREAEFRQRFRGTAINRAKWNGLRRNAAIVLGNTGTLAALSGLEQIAKDADAIVAEAAKWAIAQIKHRHG